jgi:hypothetical protein
MNLKKRTGWLGGISCLLAAGLLIVQGTLNAIASSSGRPGSIGIICIGIFVGWLSSRMLIRR